MPKITNIFVVGLDEYNRNILESIPDAEQYRFHEVLTYKEIYTEEISFTALLTKAKMVIDSAGAPVDAIIGFWDFPVSSIVPLLQRHYGLEQADLTSVVRAEHKYWARLIQREVVPGVPNFGLVDPFLDTAPPAGVSYPMWIKPVKSFASMLALKVSSDREFTEALATIRAGIGRLGDPFNALLEHVEVPPQIAAVGGHMCIAEEALAGHQVTVEGYRHGGEVTIYGIVDSIHYDNAPSFFRYVYPSTLPAQVQERMREQSITLVEELGLENMTFNIEYFWDERTDAVTLLEINPRHSQSHAELFAHVDGVTNHEILMALALGQKPAKLARGGAHEIAATWFLRRFTDGLVTRHPTPQEVAAVEASVPGVAIEINAHTGDQLSAMHGQDSYSYRLATIVIGADSEEELATKYHQVVSLLPFDIVDLASAPADRRDESSGGIIELA